MSREKPKKIKVSVGSRIFDTVNLIFLILLGLTTFYPFWDCLVVSFSSLKSYLATNIHLWPDEHERQELINYLKERDILAVYHYVPLHSAPAGIKYGRFNGEDVYTTKESERLLRLPMYYGLTAEEAAFVADQVKEFYGR